MTRSAEFLCFFRKQFFHFVGPLNDCQAKCFIWEMHCIDHFVSCTIHRPNQLFLCNTTYKIRKAWCEWRWLGSENVWNKSLPLSWADQALYSIKGWNYTNFIRLKKVDLSKSRIEDLEMQTLPDMTQQNLLPVHNPFFKPKICFTIQKYFGLNGTLHICR